MKLFRYKPNAREYTPDMLPHTRKEVFFDVLKLQWKSLFALGGLILLASLPIIACYVFEQVYSSIILDAVTAQEGTVEYTAALNKINTLSSAVAFIKIPFFAIFGVVMSGVARIIRQHAYEECVHFPTDFAEGVKQNSKSAVVLATTISAIGAISNFAYGLRDLTDGAMNMITALPTTLFVIVFIPIAAIVSVLIPVYNISFSRNIKWAIFIFAKKPVKVVISLLLAAAVFSTTLIPGFLTGLIGRVVGMILLPFAMLGFYLAMFDVLDELINKENYPEIVGKGTF